MTPAYPSPRRAGYALCVLTLLGFVLTTDMTLTALLMEPMKRDMALSDVQVALLQGTAYGLALGLASLPMGRLIDQMSRRMLLAVGIIGWTGALAAIGTAGSPVTVMVARFALGLVAALVVPAAFSLGADLYPPERRSMATSLLVVGQALGQGFGMYAGGKAFDALTIAGASPLGLAPWRVLYLLAALLGLVVLALLAGMREPARQERRDTGIDFASAAKELWRYRSFLVPLILGLLFIQITIQAASIWVSPLLIRRGLTPGAFSGWLGLILLFGGVLGALSGGRLAELGRRRGGRAGVLLPAAILCGVVAVASFFANAESLTAFAALFGLHIFSGAVVATIGVIAVTLAIPNEIRGLALGVNTFAAAVFGAAGAPAAVALLSHALGGEAMLGSAFVTICIPCALVAGGCLLLASSREKDVAA